MGASAATFCCTPRTPSAAHDLNERPASSPRRSIADSRHSLCVLRVVRPRSQLLLRYLNMISQTAARRASRRLLAQVAFEDTCRAAHRSRRSPDSPLYWNAFVSTSCASWNSLRGGESACVRVPRYSSRACVRRSQMTTRSCSDHGDPNEARLVCTKGASLRASECREATGLCCTRTARLSRYDRAS